MHDMNRACVGTPFSAPLPPLQGDGRGGDRVQGMSRTRHGSSIPLLSFPLKGEERAAYRSPFIESARVRGLVALTLSAAAALLLTVTANAANMWFTRDMPISHMNAEDVSIMQGAVFSALDIAPDGEKR